MVSDIRNKEYRRDGARCDHAKSMLMHITSHDHDKPAMRKMELSPFSEALTCGKIERRSIKKWWLQISLLPKSKQDKDNQPNTTHKMPVPADDLA